MLRVGTVPFLVARPLTEGLDETPGVTLESAPPAELARALHAGHLDVALASSVVTAAVLGPEESGLQFWEAGPVIAARRAVRSVLLFLRPGLSGPGGVAQLHTDPGSRTGSALARIVLQQRFGARFRARALDPAEDPFRTGADAVLLIGDRALRAARAESGWKVVDLGETWNDLTRLPFVFAGWVGRPGLDPAEAGAVLLPAAEKGLAQRAALVEEGVADHGFPRPFLHRYLFEDVAYHLTEAEVRSALRAFGERLRCCETALGPGRSEAESGNPVRPAS